MRKDRPCSCAGLAWGQELVMRSAGGAVGVQSRRLSWDPAEWSEFPSAARSLEGIVKIPVAVGSGRTAP